MMGSEDYDMENLPPEIKIKVRGINFVAAFLRLFYNARYRNHLEEIV